MGSSKKEDYWRIARWSTYAWLVFMAVCVAADFSEPYPRDMGGVLLASILAFPLALLWVLMGIIRLVATAPRKPRDGE